MVYRSVESHIAEMTKEEQIAMEDKVFKVVDAMTPEERQCAYEVLHRGFGCRIGNTPNLMSKPWERAAEDR